MTIKEHIYAVLNSDYDKLSSAFTHMNQEKKYIDPKDEYCSGIKLPRFDLIKKFT